MLPLIESIDESMAAAVWPCGPGCVGLCVGGGRVWELERQCSTRCVAAVTPNERNKALVVVSGWQGVVREVHVPDFRNKYSEEPGAREAQSSDEMSKALQEKLRHVLINTVGSIVELPDSALSLALLSGKATLGPGLKIKKDLFEQLGLPVVLTAGSIESIDIEIPTAHLRKKPVVVRIKQVLITLSPNPDANTRRAKLAAQERLWQQAADEGEGVDPESAMGKMVQKIVDNIHIIVEDVHIRLEDGRTSGSLESDRYAMGLVIDSFSLRSYVVSCPGARWTETCEKTVQRFLNKCLVFGANGQRQGESGLGIYVHPGEAPMPDPGTEAWRNAMLEYIMGSAAARGSPPTVSWVLGPSIIEARVSLDKQESFDGCFSRCWNAVEGAKQEIKIFAANLPIKLRHTALRNLYGLLFFYQNVSRWQQLKQNRPSGPVQGNARQWWQFAIQCELNDINRKTISEALRKVTRDGHDYVEMYSRKAGAGRPWLVDLDTEETERLQAFEDRYPADVTKTFRIRAWRDLLDGDKERQAQIQEERDVQNALLAAPSGRWGRTDLHSNFVVEHTGMVAMESGGSARKKTKESYVVVVSVPMEEAIPSIREGWLERRTNKEGNRWIRHHFVLTADELYHSAKKGAGAKKFRVSLSSCHAPTFRSDGVSFEVQSKDAAFILRCEDDEIRQAWVKDIGDAIKKRSTVETIMFDPMKHLGDANLENVSFTLHVKMEASSPTKSTFRKKKMALDDILLYMTPEAFMICTFQPITEEDAAELTELQIVRIDNADGGEAIHRVTTRFTFKRLRTWSLEQASTCCKVEVTQNAGSLTALRFFDSEATKAEEVMEAIQSCIAAVISKQKRVKERRAEIKDEIAALFEEHDPEKSGEIDNLLKENPGDKAEELLLELRAQYVIETVESADDAPAEVRVSFTEDGPLGISFGSESGDTAGWIDAIKPTGLAANFPELKHGLMLVAVQDEPVATYQQAIDAIMASVRPLHLTFRDSSTGSATPPADPDTKADEDSAEPSAGADGGAEASPEPETDTNAAETTDGASRSRWLLRYTTNSEDGAAEAIHLASYMNDAPTRSRKEYTYESELTVKHLGGVVHRFSVATTNEKSSKWLAKILDSGASKEIDLSSTPTVTPAQEELIDTMDVLQSFSFGATYTDGATYGDDDDDTPRSSSRESMRESRRTVTPPSGATPPLSATAQSGEYVMPAPTATSGKVMYDTITHASVFVEHVEVELSMAGYDICKLQGTGITADTMFNLHEAKRTSLAVVDAHVVDLYSRDSVFEQVLSAIQPVKLGTQGAAEDALGDDTWGIVRLDSAGPSLGGSNVSPDVTRGRRSSIEGVAMEEPSPGASSVEDTWSTAAPVVDPMLFCEYERAGEVSLRLGDTPYATSTTVKLKPVRLVANCELLPVLQDFVKLHDFKVMQEANKKAIGRIDRLRNDVDAASVVQPTRFVDITIAGPEFVLPESTSIEDGDTSVFMWTAEEISLKTDVDVSTGTPEEEVKQKNETASVTALRAFICNRATLLESTAARELRAMDVPLWLWLEPGGAEGPIPLPFSVAMCAKLEAAMAADEDSCENDDAGPMGASFVQFESVPPFDISCIDPEVGQAAKIVSGSAEKGELEYCKVYRDVESGLASRPPAVEQFFDEFRKNNELEEMTRARANGILLPFTAGATLKRNVGGGASSQEADLDIICQADRLQLQLSGRVLKELLVIAMHAGEAAYIHNASLARLVKTMLYEQKTWPWQRKRSKKSAGEGDGGQGSSSSSAAKKLGGLLGKLAGSKGKMAMKAAGLAKTVGTGLAASVKEAAVVDSQPGAGDDPLLEEVATGQGDAPLVCAQLKLGLLDITLKGEPRGSDSSIEPLTLGVRAHGVETGLLLSTAEARTHCALEGLGIVHSQPQDADGEASDSERNFTSWPRAGLRMIRSEAPTAADEQRERTTMLEAFKTGDSDKTIEIKKPKDLLSVVDAKELARILPVASTLVSETERVLAIAKPFAARVGLAGKIPGVPAKYADFLSELTGATEGATDDMADIVADQAAAVEEIRAKLRTLVDQQVAKYSAVAEGMIGGLNPDSAGAGALGSTVTELAQGALRGETDGIEKAKVELLSHLGAVAREKIDALSAEVEKDLTAAEEAAEGGSSMKSQVARIVLGGVRNVSESALSAEGLDAAQMRELVRGQIVALEAEIKAEVNKQLAQRVADMNIEGQISALASQLDTTTTAEGGACADDMSDIHGLRKRATTIFLNGAQELVAAVVSGDGLDATVVHELVAKQAATLEAEVKDEVSQRVAQRVKDLNLDQLGDEALSPILQKENARLATELQKLAAENAALKEELQQARAAAPATAGS